MPRAVEAEGTGVIGTPRDHEAYCRQNGERVGFMIEKYHDFGLFVERMGR
jgi:hypothetical protein